MNKSESIAKLAGALAKAQSQMEPAKKDTKGNFGKFADLGEVIDTIRKVAAPNGLSFSQFPVGDSAGVGVSTILMHESGEWLSETIYLPVSEDMAKRNGAQNAGSNITYLRRYALAAAFGVYADEDTDGQQPARQAQQTQRAAQPTPAQLAELERSAEAVGKQMAEDRRYAERNPAPKYHRTHPPLSPVQRNKLLELTRLVHGEINTEMKLEALFMEQFQHGSDTATYEDGARLTGFLLAEIRKGKNAQPQEPNIAPLPEKVHVPSHEGNGNGAHTQEDFVALVKSSKIKNAGDIVKAHTANGTTDWNAAFAELETHVKALA